MRLACLALTLLATSATARADQAPPRVSLGGGAGYPQIFHGDASLYLVRYVSVDTRVWSQALLPTKGIDGTVSLHVPFGAWSAIASGGAGVWQEIPERNGALLEDPEYSGYWRAAAGAGYLGNAIDLRIQAGVTSRPSGHSVTLNVVVMRRFPKRDGS